MRFGIVSDIHCNIGGLREALRLMGDVDAILCLGDTISHNRFSDDVVGLLRERDAQVVLGNHDADYLARLADAAVAAGRADGELVAWLRSRPERIELDVGTTGAAKRLLMVHATPWTYDYVYPDTLAMRRFAEVEADYVLGGHTHVPFAGRIGRALVINPGSTGHGRFVPPDRSLLGCATLDTATDTVELIEFPDQPYEIR